MINIRGLALELSLAGIQFTGCNTDGVVWNAGEEIQTRPDVAAVILGHDAVYWELRDERAKSRFFSAEPAAKTIPGWATWTQAQFQTWCDNNLMTDAAIDGTSLSAALKTNLKAENAAIRSIGKLLIAMRDYIWSDLPE